MFYFVVTSEASNASNASNAITTILEAKNVVICNWLENLKFYRLKNLEYASLDEINYGSVYYYILEYQLGDVNAVNKWSFDIKNYISNNNVCISTINKKKSINELRDAFILDV